MVVWKSEIGTWLWGWRRGKFGRWHQIFLVSVWFFAVLGVWPSVGIEQFVIVFCLSCNVPLDHGFSPVQVSQLTLDHQQTVFAWAWRKFSDRLVASACLTVLVNPWDLSELLNTLVGKNRASIYWMSFLWRARAVSGAQQRVAAYSIMTVESTLSICSVCCLSS